MTPIARELLAPSLDIFGRSSTLPAEAYTAESVFRWEHFFERGWICAGRPKRCFRLQDFFKGSNAGALTESAGHSWGSNTHRTLPVLAGA